jgi:hypothetical protein
MLLFAEERGFHDSIPCHSDSQVTLDQRPFLQSGLVRAKPLKGLAFSFHGLSFGLSGCGDVKGV